MCHNLNFNLVLHHAPDLSVYYTVIGIIYLISITKLDIYLDLEFDLDIDLDHNFHHSPIHMDRFSMDGYFAFFE